jgi:uncharacterized protein YbjT (DUF2867 family)
VASVFLTGGTGYMGRALATELLARGHRAQVLVRKGSEHKAPPGCGIVTGDALDGASYRHHLDPADVFVHLVGVSHPSPAKADLFRSVDLASIKEAARAAAEAGIQHCVYVSVAHPAPMMHAYIAARMEGEGALRAAGLNATILRPWYVLGPGHRWPLLLAPTYWIAERLLSTREGARRLGLVTLRQMVVALRDAVENPGEGIRVVEVPEIRKPRQALRVQSF